MRSAAVAVVIAGACLAAGATTSRADVRKPQQKLVDDDRLVVALADVHVDGVSAEIAQQFQQTLEQKIVTAHYALAPRAKVREAMSASMRWTEGCIVGGCLAEIRSTTGAPFAMLAALSGSGTSFGYVITVLRTDTGDVIAQEADRCDICTVNEAMTQATNVTIKLLGRLPAQLPDETAERHAAIALASTAARADVARSSKRATWIGATLTGVGLAAIAAGAAIYFTNDHADAGSVTLAAGAGMAASGLVVLAF